MLYCQDFTPAELNEKLSSGLTRAYYITECEAYGTRAGIPQAVKCNNLPACPFAGPELKSNGVFYAFADFSDDLLEEHCHTVKKFMDTPGKKTMFYICLDKDIDQLTYEEGIEFSEDFSEFMIELYPEFEEPGKELNFVFTNPRAEQGHSYVDFPPFCFFLIQSSDELSKGEETLLKMGYYDKLEDADLVVDDVNHHKSKVY